MVLVHLGQEGSQTCWLLGRQAEQRGQGKLGTSLGGNFVREEQGLIHLMQQVVIVTIIVATAFVHTSITA